MFIYDAIAGGIIFDMVKKGVDITTRFLKNEIKASVLENLTDEDLAIIVKQVNELSDEIKTDSIKLEEAINNDDQFKKFFPETKYDPKAVDSRIIVEDSFIDKSPIINTAYGNVSINYGKDL